MALNESDITSAHLLFYNVAWESFKKSTKKSKKKRKIESLNLKNIQNVRRFFQNVFLLVFCPKTFLTSMKLIHFLKLLFSLELLFSLDWHFGGFNLKNEAWWDVYFSLLIFRIFSFWSIKSADLQDSGHQSNIWTRWRLYNYLI